MKKGYLLRRSGVASRCDPQWENAVVRPSASTKRITAESVAEGVTDGLPIEADRPSLQRKSRARAKRSARTSTRSPGHEKSRERKRRIAQSSSDSEETADDTQTPTATATAGSEPEARTATQRDLDENEDAGEKTLEMSANDKTPPLSSTRARKAVPKLGGIMIRWIQESERFK